MESQPKYFNPNDHKRELIGTARHFRWNEVVPTYGILPTSPSLVKNIILLADYLECIRETLGSQPMYVSSWYRSSTRNRAIGGAKNSLHLTGLAVDFGCLYLTSYDIYDKLDTVHGCQGGLGLYRTHVHLDLRGYRARWDNS